MRLLPVLPVLALLAVVGVLRPDLLTEAARTPRAWAAAAVVVLAGTVVRWAIGRRRPGVAPWAGSAVTLLGTAALLLPALHERTLVEDFPVVLAGPSATTVPAAALVLPSATPTSSPTTVSATRAPAPTRAPAAPTPSAPPSPTAAPTRVATPAPTPTTTTPTATRLLTGSLDGIGHHAEGTTTLYRVDGALVLRFEDVDISGSVDPSVHLVPQGQRSPGGGIRLGALKAEHGSFSYPVPASFDLGRAWSVLVWCDPYDTPIGASDLR